MKRVPLDAILLLIFGFIFLSGFMDPFDPLFFVLFFCFSFFYLVTGLVDNEKLKKIRTPLLFAAIIFLLAVILVPEIIARQEGRSWMVHDNVLQIEAATDFLIKGKNPYSEHYFSTPLITWKKIMTTDGRLVDNYSLFHCVKLPWDIIFAVPFKLLSEYAAGFYDQRMLYLLLYIFCLFLVYGLAAGSSDRDLFLVLFGLNPLFADYVVIGYGDIFVLTWVLLFLYLLKKDRILWAGFVLGLACSSKHSAWFFVPFYLLYLWFRCNSPRRFAAHAWPVAVAPLVLFTPFIIWDPVSFWQDIYHYPAGTISTSYHINGFGFSMFLYSRGILESIYSAYPAWLFQVPLGGALFYFLFRWQKNNNTVAQMTLNCALFLFVFWFFSRFFHENYLGYLTVIFMTAYFTYEDEADREPSIPLKG